jgi:tetratricopeptide (TPR) repeat protein
MVIHTLALLAQLAGAELGPSPEPAAYSPEWFYQMAFADSRDGSLARGLRSFYAGDFQDAWSQTVGAGMRAADQALAQGALELSMGAQALLDGREDSAKALFLRCAEHGSQAMASAEYPSQVMRSAVLRARCQSVLPDRIAAARTLDAAARDLSEPADAQEFLYGAARLEEDLGRPDSARNLFRKAYEKHPRGELAAQSLLALATLEERQGQPSRALAEIAKVRELSGLEAATRAQAAVLEGRCLKESGDTARARLRWMQVANALAKGDTSLADSSAAAEGLWRLGDLAAREADGILFDAPDRAVRTLAHARRREKMDEAFGYWYQSLALMEYPWSALSIRDIGTTIEHYADAVAHQTFDAKSDTDRAASEIRLQKKLPAIFQSAGRIYKRQIMLARRDGDGSGIGLQSGQGLARTWWQAARCQREAARLIRISPRPFGTPTALAWYETQVDSAERVELWHGKTAAREGLQELARWEQLQWPEADSLKAFLGDSAADSVVSIGTRERLLAEGTQAPASRDFTPLQWRWKIQEARRLQRETVLDVRILRARLEGM